MKAVRWASLWLPPVVFMVGVFALASPERTDVDLDSWDKLVHVVAYGVFGVFNLRAAHGGLRGLRPAPTLFALLLTAGYGAFDEWNQMRFPGRDASMLDWFADLIGALLAIPVAAALSREP